jgi:hypothetical protein
MNCSKISLIIEYKKKGRKKETEKFAAARKKKNWLRQKK